MGKMGDDVPVVEHELAAEFGGALYMRDREGPMILLAPSLDGPERRWALAHELAHHYDGTLSPPAPPALMERAEWRVDQVALGRLVPEANLIEFIEEQPAGEGVTPGEVAEEFGVPVTVATRALDQLSRRYP